MHTAQEHDSLMLLALDASPALRPNPSGTETYAREMITHLAQSNPGHTVRLYANASAAPAWSPAGVEWRLLPFPRLWTHWRFRRAIQRERPDVVFVPSHVLPLAINVPGVVTIHDLGHRHVPSYYRPSAWLYLEWMTRSMARRAARLIAVSQATADDLVRFYRVPRERIAVIHSGVDDALAPPTSAEVAQVRERYGLPPTYFLYVGRAHPRKNLPTLLQAYRGARRNGMTAGLVLAGPGHQPATDEGVRSLAYVPRADLPALYGGALALTLPSRFEGFGFPALEAMRCGTPVLASTAGALPEIVGEAGLLVDPDDVAAWTEALHRLAQDPALRQQLIARGQVHSRGFSWATAATSTWSVLQQACLRRPDTREREPER
jgi:glycosyltransferase involved in cell wall biosynthesis